MASGQKGKFRKPTGVGGGGAPWLCCVGKRVWRAALLVWQQLSRLILAGALPPPQAPSPLLQLATLGLRLSIRGDGGKHPWRATLQTGQREPRTMAAGVSSAQSPGEFHRTFWVLRVPTQSCFLSRFSGRRLGKGEPRDAHRRGVKRGLGGLVERAGVPGRLGGGRGRGCVLATARRRDLAEELRGARSRTGCVRGGRENPFVADRSGQDVGGGAPPPLPAATAAAAAAGQVHSSLPGVALSPAPWGKAGKVLGAAGQGLPRVSRSPRPPLSLASPQQCCLLLMQNLGQEWGCPGGLQGAWRDNTLAGRITPPIPPTPTSAPLYRLEDPACDLLPRYPWKPATFP